MSSWALAVAAPFADGTSMDGTIIVDAGAIYVYDWDPSINDWGEGMAVANETSADQKFGSKGVAITIDYTNALDSTNALLHAVDRYDTRNSFEVSSFSFLCRIECTFFGI